MTGSTLQEKHDSFHPPNKRTAGPPHMRQAGLSNPGQNRGVSSNLTSVQVSNGTSLCQLTTPRLVRWPEDALAVLTFRTLWNRGVAFERELLQPGTLIGFRGVNIAL